MKKNDIALIILIVSISLVVSFFIGKAVIGDPKNSPVKVEVVTPISADFKAPDPRIFNDKSLDPTQSITIGSGNKEQPFQ